MRLIAATVMLAMALAGCGPARSLPPCPTEDSVGCHWDATAHGNGIGRSFDVNSQGNVTYTR